MQKDMRAMRRVGHEADQARSVSQEGAPSETFRADLYHMSFTPAAYRSGVQAILTTHTYTHNHTHKYMFPGWPAWVICTACLWMQTPAMPATRVLVQFAYALMSGVPPQPIGDEDRTLADAGLLNAVIIQRK